jgi:hypothetical protein
MKTKYQVTTRTGATNSTIRYAIKADSMNQATEIYYKHYRADGDTLITILPMGQERKAGWIPCAVIA